MPETPGIYPVMVGVWETPLEPRYDTGLQSTETFTSITQSNMLFYEVVEPGASD